MPTYEYRCQACGHEFELFQQMSAAVKRKCPECAKPKLQRLIGTGAGIIFKGGGFYETDYRSDSYKKAAEAEKKSVEPAKADSKSDTKSEATGQGKSDAKSETPASTAVEPKPTTRARRSSAKPSKSRRGKK